MVFPFTMQVVIVRDKNVDRPQRVETDRKKWCATVQLRVELTDGPQRESNLAASPRPQDQRPVEDERAH